MKHMWRFRWKIRRGIKNIKRFAVLSIVLTSLYVLQNYEWNLPSGEKINQWTMTSVTILFMLTLFFISYKLCSFYLRRRKLKRANIFEIDTMSGEEFENYLVHFFSRLGYKCKVTPLSGDHGADLILKKDGITTVVQAKRYKNKVGNNAVQEIVASKRIYNAQRAMCVTNSVYTNAAVQLAEANDVELWDRNKLIHALAKMDIESHKTSRVTI